jgi:hypothetical protein
MTIRLAFMLLALTVTVTRAAETLDSHSGAPHKVVTIRGDGAQPQDLALAKGDVLVFENYAQTPMTITFTEPESQADMIHCGLVRPSKSANAPAWALFRFDQRNRLTATLPPGQFASVCSLAPGSYTYEAVRAGGTRIGATRTPAKNTITVQ